MRLANRRRAFRTIAAAVALSCASAALAAPQPVRGSDGYRRPPAPIADILEAPVFPDAFVSPARDVVLLATPLRMPPARDLARPYVRANGIDVEPATNGVRDAAAYAAFQLVRIADGAVTPIDLPAGTHASAPVWKPDGSAFAYVDATSHGSYASVVTTATGLVRTFEDRRLVGLFGDAVAWLPAGDGLLVHAIDVDRPATPQTTGDAPIVRETRGGERGAPSDAIAGGAADEERLAYYARGTYATLDVESGRLTPIVPAGIYAGARVSPDGSYVAFRRYAMPLAPDVAWDAAPHDVVVAARGGGTVATIANERPGASLAAWQPNAPATLVWIAERRSAGDAVDVLDVRHDPGNPHAVLGTQARIDDVAFLDGASTAVVRDYDRHAHLSRTLEFDVDAPAQPAELGAMADGDAFDDPGRPLERIGRNGASVVARDGAAVFLTGDGYTTAGIRPFVDRVDGATHTKRRLFTSALDPLETVVAMLDDRGTSFLIRRQSPVMPPDLFVRDAGGRLRQLTHFVDPSPALRTLRPRVVTYKRADGVGCSFTLYLPPAATPGTPLPTLLWAYPFEFDDPRAASQNANFVQTFDDPHDAAARLAAFAGYAVLDRVSMPIVATHGDASDTLVAQLTMDARAAIDEAASLGVTDRSRVAIGGHSYGAFMAATLLAHTSLFRAGIARSGAYNRSLTPFGFQNEPRSFWDAPDVYAKLSPFAYANRIASPLLLIAGTDDENPATPALQSERMYDAIRGTGGTARLVLLPNEGHTYVSREAVETAEAETIAWLDRYLGRAAR